MGLTIHYSLKTSLPKPKDVRTLLETLRQFALDLPFEEVGEIQEFKGVDTDYQNCSDSERWLKVQARGHLEHDSNYYSVNPKHVIAFTTWPGEGCEAANFGFCKYPAFIQGENKRIATHLNGWSWGSFCKTQYASNPKYGGVEHFLRCHLCVIRMLDFLKKSDLATVEVKDEGDYWEKRDLQALAKEVGDWNMFIAGLAGEVESALGMTGQAPIKGFPSFEHLEAKGQEKLEMLRQALTKKEKHHD